jgi:outer membrane immunogenic protein
MVGRCGVRYLVGGVLGTILLVGQMAPSAAAEPPPAPIWTGVYVGAHGGYGSADISYTFDTFVGPENFSHSPHDWFVGAHLGVQRQWGQFVAGLEVAYSDLNLTDTVESKLLPDRFRQIDIDSLFTLTARLGYASERWMAYVKGGYANANVDTLVYGGGGTGSATSGRESGWTIGAGLDLICGRGFLLGLEYNYVQLNIDDRHGLLPDLKPFTYTRFDDDIHTVTVRLSYLFGRSPKPEPLK